MVGAKTAMDSKQAVILLAKVLNPPPFPASPNDGGDSGWHGRSDDGAAWEE